MNSETCVRVEARGDVAGIILDRPQALNALSTALLRDLLQALEDAKDARAIVLGGEGTSFCAGEDLRQTLAPKTGRPEELRASLQQIQQITRLLTAHPAPVIAAVQGYAIGGGAELALAADLIVVHPELQLRFPEVTIGHAVTGGISTRLPAIVGLIRAKELLMTGRWVGAEEAVRIGMANEMNADPLARAYEWAGELAALPKRSLRATKQGLELATVANQESVLRAEVDAALYCFASDDSTAIFERFQETSPTEGE